MSRTRPSALRDTVRFMLYREQYSEALRLFEQAANNIRQSRDWRSLLEVFLVPRPNGLADFLVPAELLRERDWRILIGRVLSGAREDARLSDWIERCLNATGQLEPELEVLHAYVLICSARYAHASETLHRVLEHLSGPWLALAHQRLIWTAHHLRRPWDTHLEAARHGLAGRGLGLALLDAAECAYSDNDLALSQRLTLEALPLLRGDTLHHAQAHLRLGFDLLRGGDLGAETHFLRGYQETLKAEGKALRAKALNGLAALRRVQGEWRIALEYYRRASKAAIDADDTHELELASLNTARTQRLSGNPRAAIQTLETALRQGVKHPDMFRLELAAALLVCGETRTVSTLLEQSRDVYGADRFLYAILAAELARGNGQYGQVLELLRGVPMTERLAREEVTHFPELFAWAAAQGLHVPEPLPFPVKTVVRIVQTSRTKLQVFVNERRVPQLEDTQDAAALLRLLRTPNTPVKTDDLAVAIFALEEIEQIESGFRDLTNKIVSRLRHKLGYPESVRHDRHAYWLDADTIWIFEQA